MKTHSAKSYVLCSIGFVMLFGSGAITLPDLSTWFENTSPATAGFATAHAGLVAPTVDENDLDCRNGRQDSLPAPNALLLQDYERVLYNFILRRKYAALNWCVDKRVRDTGPWIEGSYYGVHPAVRIYYSPQMMYWLTGDPDYWQQGKAAGKAHAQKPRTGLIPDGAMIVKEMYTPPAELYGELQEMMKQNPDCRDNQAFEKLLDKLISAWTVMVKSSDGAHDGWFWAGPSARKMVGGKLQTIPEAIESQLDDYSDVASSGYGAPCIRCHASADKESTFSDLKNIKGFLPDENLLGFRADNSWRSKSHFKDYPLSILMMKQPCLQDSMVKAVFALPAPLRPWTHSEDPAWQDFMRFHRHHPDTAMRKSDVTRLTDANPVFTATYPQISGQKSSGIQAFPMQWADHVVPKNQPEQYITSDNCLGCHGGLGGNPYDVTMFLQTGPAYGQGHNVSEYEEWRWSPMGLAGRDPIFYAQMESEKAYLEMDAKQKGPLKGPVKILEQQLSNTCMSCHNSMGQRQLAIDAATDKTLDPIFKSDYVYLTTALSAKDPKPADYQYHKYGNLGREGISCMTCHHITAPDSMTVANWKPAPGWVKNPKVKDIDYMLFFNTTGRYASGPADTLYGPFKDVKALPMKNSMGITPRMDEFIQNSRMCGTCHTINLPNIGMTKDQFPVLTAAEQNPALSPYPHTLEQSTFVEWLNSSFAQREKDGRQSVGFKSCQDCHMPAGFESLDGKTNIKQVTTKIATIQDADYPQADNRAPDEEIRLYPRANYKRHEHIGLNAFLLEMFNQFPDVLGVAKQDYMTSDTTGNRMAIENMVRQAETATVDLNVQVKSLQGNQLTVDVSVRNKTGHRFPSGVAFRRAFLEFVVMDGEKVVWSSGRTNSVGVIVGPDGQPLKTEFLPDANSYQPHYQVINRQDQVQIYEELVQNASNAFSTSFVHRVHTIKDNRLLPKGWRDSKVFEAMGDVLYQFVEATDPHVSGDPDYMDQGADFPGMDNLQYVATLPDGVQTSNLSVRVSMYYQATPPYYLYQRFSAAPNGVGTQRLYYLTSHLNLKGTPIENWKLPLVSATSRKDAKSDNWTPVRGAAHKSLYRKAGK
jgi:hypothetical protein